MWGLGACEQTGIGGVNRYDQRVPSFAPSLVLQRRGQALVKNQSYYRGEVSVFRTGQRSDRRADFSKWR